MVFSICVAGSYILKSVYLDNELLFQKVLLKTMEHCLLISKPLSPNERFKTKR